MTLSYLMFLTFLGSLKNFLDKSYSDELIMKNEFKVIADLIEQDKKVLDVGCADGTLMKFLKDNKNINIRGLEISKDKVQKCIANGLTVIEGNAEKDLITIS